MKTPVALPPQPAAPSPEQLPGAGLAIGDCVRAIENSLHAPLRSLPPQTRRYTHDIPAWMLTHLEARNNNPN